MIHQVARRWISVLIEQGYLEEERQDWYLYAVERRLGYCVAFLWLVAVGLVFRAPLQTLLFFGSAVFLRSRTGGWHASTSGMCQVLSFAVTATVMWAVCTVPVQLAWLICLVMMPVCCAVVLFCAPVNHKNLHLTRQELQANHNKSVQRLLLLCAVCALLHFLFPQSTLGISVAAGMAVTSAGIVAAKFVGEETIDETK